MLRHSVAYLVIRGVNGVLGLAALFVLTRLLSADQYGLYALGLAAINLLATVFFHWLNAGVARLYAAQAGTPDAFFGQVRRLFRTAACVGLVILAGWLLLRPPNGMDTAMGLAIGGGALAMGLYNLHLQLLNSSQQPRRYGLLSTTRAAVTLALAVLAVLAGAGSVGALVAISVGGVTAVILFGHRWQPAVTSEGRDVHRQLVTYGTPLAITYLAAMVIDLSDRFLIGWWYGPAAVSGYAASHDLSLQTIGVLLNVFYLAAFPLVTREWESGGPEAARRAMIPLARALLLVAPAVAATFIGMPHDLVRIMFGPSLHADAATVMPWLAAACTLAGLRAYLFDIGLHLERRAGTQLRIMLVIAGCNVSLNVALLPLLGIVGSAISAALAALIGLALSYAAGRRAGAYPRLAPDLAKAVLALVLSVAVLRGLSMLMPESPGVLLVAAKMLAGLLAFAVAALALDLAASRSTLADRWANR